MQFQHLLLFCDHPMGPDVHHHLCINIYALVDFTTGTTSMLALDIQTRADKL